MMQWTTHTLHPYPSVFNNFPLIWTFIVCAHVYVCGRIVSVFVCTRLCVCVCIVVVFHWSLWYRLSLAFFVLNNSWNWHFWRVQDSFFFFFLIYVCFVLLNFPSFAFFWLFSQAWNQTFWYECYLNDMVSWFSISVDSCCNFVPFFVKLDSVL